MAPSLVERQVLRTRNGLAHLAGLTRPAVAQTPRDLVWSARRRGCGATAATIAAIGRRS